MIYTDKIHLISDLSIEELHNFADKIELNRCWFERKKKKNRPHYDLVNKNYEPLFDEHGIMFIKKSIDNGAKLISTKEIISILSKL